MKRRFFWWEGSNAWTDTTVRPPPGLEVDAIYVDSTALDRRAEAADAIVLVTGHVSHAAALKVRAIARRRGVPLVSALTPGISSVRGAIGAAFLSVRRAMPAA